MVAISLVMSSMVWSSGIVSADDYYTFPTEDVNIGTSTNPTYRNAIDGTFNSLREGDYLPDANLTLASYWFKTGSVASGSMPSDIANYGSYLTVQEDGYNIDATQTIYPTGDSSIGFDTTYPTDPTTHYDKIDETTHDDDTTYNTAVTNGDRDVFGMGDLSFTALPSIGYDLNVTLYYWSMRSGTGVSSMDVGLVISAADYVGINDYSAGASYAVQTYTWDDNPATAAEWTSAEVNALELYMVCADAAPDVRVTLAYLSVSIDYPLHYELDLRLNYTISNDELNHMDSSATGRRMYPLVNVSQVDVGEDENLKGYYYSSYSSAWTWWSVFTIPYPTWLNRSTSYIDADYPINASHEVRWRLWAIMGGPTLLDPVQNTYIIDLFKLRVILTEWELDVELSSTTVPEYGNLSIVAKGYSTDALEAFHVDVWNYTADEWDLTRINISATVNTQYTIDLCDSHHREGQTVLVRLRDIFHGYDNSTIDGRDICFLDYLAVSHNHTDPEIQAYGAIPDETTEGDPVYFFCQYWDYDNSAPSYVRVHIGESYYAMTANDTDSTYYDGKSYYLTKSDLDPGVYDYWFAVKDANSDEITTAAGEITVNELANDPPVFTSSPTTSTHTNVLYTYDANATDTDTLTFDLEGNITGWASIVPSTGVVSGTPTAIGIYWMNVSVDDGYNDLVWQNTSITVYNTAPVITSSPTTSAHNNTLYSYDAQATDTDSLTWDLEGNITDWATINPSTGVVSGTPTAIGVYWMDVSVDDGYNALVWQNTSITIYTDSPTITSSPSLTWQHGTTYSYQAAATDPESEALVWALTGNCTDILDISVAGLVSGLVPTMGYWECNLTVTDGVNTNYQTWTLTALNTVPVFITTPDLAVLVNDTYAYDPSASDANGDTLTYSIDTSPESTLAWLTLNVTTGIIEGLPNATGSYLVNLSVSDGIGLTQWQNYTVVVYAPQVIGERAFILGFILALILGIGMPVCAWHWDIPALMVYSGFVWIFASVETYLDISIGLTILALGAGLALLYYGGLQFSGEGER